MQKTIWMIAISSLISLRLFALPPAFAEGDDYDEDDYYDRVGLSSSSADYKALSTSMVAWGIALAVVITVVTVLVSPSTSESSSGGGGSSSHSH